MERLKVRISHSSILGINPTLGLVKRAPGELIIYHPINLRRRLAIAPTILYTEIAIIMVKFVESEGEWAELMEKSNEMLVVVDFTASW